MSMNAMSEQQVLQALRQVPCDRWPEVLRFVTSLIGGPSNGVTPSPIRTAAELAKSEVVGLWSGRPEASDSQAFARQLREQAEHARESRHAPGH